jgi:diguanylate cyclase (GGDEF)-like protein
MPAIASRYSEQMEKAEQLDSQIQSPSLSLTRRFALIFGAIVLIVGLGVYRFAVWYEEDVVDTLAHRLVERNALYEKSQLLGLMTREIALAQKMASSPILGEWVHAENDPQRLRRAIAELEDYRQFFYSKSYFFTIAQSGHYYFNDEKGGHASDTPRYTIDPSNPKDGWFHATLRRVKDVELNVDTDRFLGLTRVWINTIVRDAQGRAVAVTGSGIDLSEIIKRTVSSDNAAAYNFLIDEHGAIQAHHDVSKIDFTSARKTGTTEKQHTVQNLLGSPDDARQLSDAMQSLIAGTSSVLTLKLQLEGKTQLVGLAWIPEMRWFVLSVLDPTLNSSDSRLPLGIIALGIVLLVVMLAAAFLIDRLVLRRLRLLDRATAELAAGNFRLTINDDSRDEFGRLGRAFVSMAERIANSTDDLKRQVAERTADLLALANHDALTGLLNRRGMDERLSSEMNRLRREHGSLGLLQLDLDHFKQVNDGFGHAAGDAVLEAVAACLRLQVRDYDACARWGGEEFLIALFDIDRVDEVVQIAEKLRAAIAALSISWQGESISITTSIGALISQADEDIDRLLSHADAACYEAKSAGRNRVVMFRS